MPPATRAKSAMVDAPNASPLSHRIESCMYNWKYACVLDAGRREMAKTKNITEMPRSPSATTVKPMTAPPAYATFSALFSPVFAASIVFTLVLVATSMPTYPAVADSTAPTMKLLDGNVKRRRQRRQQQQQQMRRDDDRSRPPLWHQKHDSLVNHLRTSSVRD